MVTDPNPKDPLYFQSAAEQMCSIGDTKDPALFNPDRCGVLQRADSTNTDDTDLQPVPKGQKQALPNDTVRVCLSTALAVCPTS